MLRITFDSGCQKRFECVQNNYNFLFVDNFIIACSYCLILGVNIIELEIQMHYFCQTKMTFHIIKAEQNVN